jgi:hypothetical protein
MSDEYSFISPGAHELAVNAGLPRIGKMIERNVMDDAEWL